MTATHCFEMSDISNSSSRILLTISPFYGYDRNYTLNDLARKLAGQIDEEKGNIVEENVKLQYIQGLYGNGVFFTATDKNYDSQKDDYPFMMRCCYISNRYVVEITILCQSKNSNVITQIFEWMRTLQ
jgi:hypothetical protein